MDDLLEKVVKADKKGSFEFVFYQSGVLVEIKGKKQSRRIHFLVQNAFQIVDSSAVVS